MYYFIFLVMIYFGMGLIYVINFFSICNILLIDIIILKKKEKEILVLIVK